MGTRSYIAKRNEDGTYKGIYCHWDGYLDNNGKILAEHYQDPAKVDAMIALGDLSSLGTDIGEKHDFDATPRPKGMCTYYGRDRGEDGTEAKTHKTFDECKAEAADCANGYFYYFQDNQWFVIVLDHPSRALIEALADLKSEDEADQE